MRLATTTNRRSRGRSCAGVTTCYSVLKEQVLVHLTTKYVKNVLEYVDIHDLNQIIETGLRLGMTPRNDVATAGKIALYNLILTHGKDQIMEALERVQREQRRRKIK